MTFTCGTESGTTPLTISAATTSPSTATTTTTTATTPTGAVATGAGGSVLTADPLETAAGALLLAGASVGALWITRRRRAGGAVG
ncbi:hypothetical protein GXW82_05185 [Streptacidiphilus sp. 4-A2]|nr:hypothetical protein [Streptacidiphilus sp. 4-A2]